MKLFLVPNMFHNTPHSAIYGRSFSLYGTPHSMKAIAVYIAHLRACSIVPRPLLRAKKGLVTKVGILGCADSAVVGA